jgi:hypothetical protein
MYAFIWLGAIVILMTLLVLITNQISGFRDYKDYTDADYNYITLMKNLKKEGKLKYNTDPLNINVTKAPKDLTVDIVKSTEIAQAPFPPCVGYVDEVVYAPSDTNADIARIKADLANLQKNIPNYVTDGVNQQAPLLMKGLLRQQGFPLQDDQYGQNLACN